MRVLVTGGAGFIGSQPRARAASRPATTSASSTTCRRARREPAPARVVPHARHPRRRAARRRRRVRARGRRAPRGAGERRPSRCATPSATAPSTPRARAPSPAPRARPARRACSRRRRRRSTASRASALPLPETAPKAPGQPVRRLASSPPRALLAEELAGQRRRLRVVPLQQRVRPAAGRARARAASSRSSARACDAGEPPVIYGDGTQTRDFIYVGDVVGAIIAALRRRGAARPPSGLTAPPYNISTGARDSASTTCCCALRAGLRVLGAGRARSPRARATSTRSSLDPAKAERGLRLARARQTLDDGARA